MNFHYLQANEVRSILPLDEAISTAIFDAASADTKFYVGFDGEITLVPPPGWDDPQERMDHYAASRQRLQHAALDAEIRVVVQSPADGRVYFVPRGYWLKHTLWQSPVLEDDAAPAGLNGQPLAAEQAAIEDWKRVLGRAASEESESAPARGRKKGVGSYAADDNALAARMHEMIARNEAASAWDATRLLVGEIRGAGSEDSKRKRVAGVYNRLYC